MKDNYGDPSKCCIELMEDWLTSWLVTMQGVTPKLGTNYS